MVAYISDLAFSLSIKLAFCFVLRFLVSMVMVGVAGHS